MALGTLWAVDGAWGERAAKRTQSLNASCLGTMNGSVSCYGEWRDTGVHKDVGRAVLFNDFSKPFGKVEVSPNGEEALWREQEALVQLVLKKGNSNQCKGDGEWGREHRCCREGKAWSKSSLPHCTYRMIGHHLTNEVDTLREGDLHPTPGMLCREERQASSAWAPQLSPCPDSFLPSSPTPHHTLSPYH